MDASLLQDLLVQALNLSLMFSVGLELDLARLRAILDRKALLLSAIAFNFLAVPAMAAGLNHLMVLPAGVATGLLLAALCPGGGTGTLLTRAAKGSLELSVLLLGVLTLLAVPLVPVLMTVAGGSLDIQQQGPGPLLKTLLLFQLAPLLAGVALKRAASQAAAKANRVAKPVSNTIFGVLVVGLLVTRGHLVTTVGLPGLTAMVMVSLSSLVLPILWPLERAERAALSLTSGVRNLALALLLSSSFFSDETTIAVLSFGLFMYLLGLPLALIWRVRAPVGA
ncbi:MAG: bile acid:sodium symporter [Myxococcota bacterium]|nr:bile acid:sodium symporter [Myxococcota bacterium]